MMMRQCLVLCMFSFSMTSCLADIDERFGYWLKSLSAYEGGFFVEYSVKSPTTLNDAKIRSVVKTMRVKVDNELRVHESFEQAALDPVTVTTIFMEFDFDEPDAEPVVEFGGKLWIRCEDGIPQAFRSREDAKRAEHGFLNWSGNVIADPLDIQVADATLYICGYGATEVERTKSISVFWSIYVAGFSTKDGSLLFFVRLPGSHYKDREFVSELVVKQDSIALAYLKETDEDNWRNLVIAKIDMSGDAECFVLDTMERPRSRIRLARSDEHYLAGTEHDQLYYVSPRIARQFTLYGFQLPLSNVVKILRYQVIGRVHDARKVEISIPFD